MEGAWQLLVFLFLPQLLGFLVRFARALYNWKRHVVLFRRMTRVEGLVVGLLLVRSGWLLYCLSAPKELYFAKTHTPIDSPAYLVRNAFRSYVSQREGNEEDFREMMRVRREKLGDAPDPDRAANLYTKHVEVEQEYVELERLSMELRAKDYRRRYVLYGPEAPECQVCGGDSWFYLGLVVPSILKEYLVLLVLVGLVGMYPSKASWRKYALGATLLLLGYEAMEWGLSDDVVIMLNPVEKGSGAGFLTRPEQLERLRHGVLGVLGLLVCLIDFVPASDPDLVALTSIAKAVEETTVNLQTARLANAAVLGTEALRKTFVEYFKKNEYDRSRMVADPLYERLRGELNLRYRPATIVEEALRMSKGSKKSD